MKTFFQKRQQKPFFVFMVLIKVTVLSSTVKNMRQKLYRILSAGLQRDFFLCLGFPGDNLVLDLMAYYRCFWKGQFKLIFRLVYIFCLHYEWLHCLMSAEQVMTSDIPLYLQLENRIGFFKHLFYSEINNLNFTIIYFLFGSGSVKAKVRRNWNRYIVITYILLLTFVMKPKSYLLFVIS
jgi:hypothetical protein